MKVMIRLPNWVGDAVMAEPALRELRRIYADAHITFVARPWVAGLFAGEQLHDELIAVAEGRGAFAGARRFVADVRRLHSEAFDCAVLLTNSFGTALMARAARVKNLAGYATDWRGALLHTVIPFEKGYRSRHQVFYYLHIAAELERLRRRESNVDFLDVRPQLHATPESQQQARELLSAHGIDLPASSALADPAANNATANNAVEAKSQKPKAKILALIPGATNSRAKLWLPERFAATADRLAAEDGYQTMIIGTTGDAEAANQVQQLMRAPSANLAGKTSLATLKGVLSLCRLAISNDTGAAHVAAALGVPTVVIFGPTEHVSTRPLSHRAAVVRHDVECSPCMLRDCPIDHICMTRVEVNDVYLAAKNLLNQTTGELIFDV